MSYIIVQEISDLQYIILTYNNGDTIKFQTSEEAQEFAEKLSGIFYITEVA